MKNETKHPEIPHGSYCYKFLGLSENGKFLTKRCPHWSIDRTKPEQENGYCAFLKRGDWEQSGLSLLWDEVKECSENLNDPDEKANLN